MNKKLITLCLCGALLVSGCGKVVVPKLENGEEVVASIDGKQFTANDLYKSLKEQVGTATLVNLIDDYIISREYTDNDAAKSYADKQYQYLKESYAANGQDLDDAILSNGYKSVAAFKEYIAKDFKSTKVVEKYLTEKLTDKEIEKYYKDEIFGKMTVRHILIIPDVDTDATDTEKAAAKDKALKEAKDLIKKLNEGAKFEDLAKEHSDDTGTASNGGLYENFTKDSTDAAFWSAAYKLENGKYTTTPVESAYGYHIIYKISMEAKPTKESSLDKIKEDLVSDKLEKDTNLKAKTWSDVRKKYKLNIVETNLKNEYNDLIKNLK